MPSPEYTQSEIDTAEESFRKLSTTILKSGIVGASDADHIAAVHTTIALTRANARIAELERDLADVSTALRHATESETRLLGEINEARSVYIRMAAAGVPMPDDVWGAVVEWLARNPSPSVPTKEVPDAAGKH